MLDRPLSISGSFHIGKGWLWRYASEYGTVGDGLTENIKNTENKVDNVFLPILHREAIVTFTTNGTHKKGSLHYSGNAIDLRTRDMTTAQRQRATRELRRILGDNFDVLDEGDHIHVEYDPLSKPCK